MSPLRRASVCATGACPRLGDARNSLVLDFALKAVDLVHVVGLVVPARDVEVVRVQNLEADHGQDNLERERAAVNKVAIEELPRTTATAGCLTAAR